MEVLCLCFKCLDLCTPDEDTRTAGGSAGGSSEIDARLGADAGDEALTSGACGLYAGNNAIAAILKSVHDLDYDTAGAQKILLEAHPEAEDGMNEQMLEEWVNQYMAEGNGLPLLGGGSVTFGLQMTEDDEPQPGDVVAGKFTHDQAKICVGHVDPPLDLDNSYHYMVFIEGDGDTITCRNSWANQKEITIPGKEFDSVDMFYAMKITDVEQV